MLGFAVIPSRVVVATLVAVWTTLLFAAQGGCGDDDGASIRASRRGETCRVTNDCAEGLACAPIPGGSGGGVCITAQFRVPVSAKECAIVECTSSTDCCEGDLAGGCLELRRCLEDVDAGVGTAEGCKRYEKQCLCASGRITCEIGKCISRCAFDDDCSGSQGRRCASGTCVQCTIDGDCPSGRQCVSGSCKPPCTTDGDCAGFDRCVVGRCIASGCQIDRECVASTRNVEAQCGTDGKCIVPCETDLECGNPTSYSFFSCIERQCTYVGCESDKDCRLFFTGTDASPLPVKQHIVCRDPGILGTVVRP